MPRPIDVCIELTSLKATTCRGVCTPRPWTRGPGHGACLSDAREATAPRRYAWPTLTERTTAKRDTPRRRRSYKAMPAAECWDD